MSPSSYLLRKSLAGSPGCKDTSNRSKPKDRPTPFALINPSFLVQQLKNASALYCCCREHNRIASAGEKNRFAIDSKFKLRWSPHPKKSADDR
jgi:hypothetical protein